MLKTPRCCSIALALFLFGTSFGAKLSWAWISPAAHLHDCCSRRPSPLTTTPLFANGDDDRVVLVQASSRRTWFSQVASAAAAAVATSGAIALPFSAQAAVATAAPERPVSPAVCDTAVSVLVHPETGRKVYILGTAHISSQSADVAGQLVRDVKPNAVFVELDAKRVGQRTGSIVVPPPNSSDGVVSSSAVMSSSSASDTVNVKQEQTQSSSSSEPTGKSLFPSFNFRQRALQAGSVAVGNTIQGMYKKLNSSGFSAGQEFVVAVREGQKIGSSIVLGDRDVEVTLRRLTEALAQTDLAELMNPDGELEKSMKELLPAAGQPPNPSTMGDAEFRQEMSSYVETMKARDNVQKIMGELKKAAPAIYTALVEERDAYMGSGLNSLNQFATIVAVMGIAHMEGVEGTLEQLGWRHVPMRCPKV